MKIDTNEQIAIYAAFEQTFAMLYGSAENIGKEHKDFARAFFNLGFADGRTYEAKQCNKHLKSALRENERLKKINAYLENYLFTKDNDKRIRNPKRKGRQTN